MGILIPLVLIFFTCLFIWRACDGFERASEYIGRNLSEGVRGGTINAIASSIPELFTTLIALFVLSDKEGFSVGIGTTAGSALFNGMIIPAVCVFTVVGSVVLGTRVQSVNVMPKVLLRDGLSLIFCELILVLCISGSTLDWWQGALLMGLYAAYLLYMLSSMKTDPEEDEGAEDHDEADETDEPKGAAARAFYWLSLGPLLDLESIFIKEKQEKQIEDETWNGWPLLIAATSVIGAACWLLVHACEWLGSGAYTLMGLELEGFGWPAMFVAVIFASMATSVPDTVISIRDARDGDYNDAVANALGSNIFDICFALGFPLFVFTLINGPITMDPDTVAQSSELRLLLLMLTIVAFFVYFVGKRTRDSRGRALVKIGKGKASLLMLIYALFVGYVIARSGNEEWANSVSEALRGIVAWLPSFS